MNEYNPELIGEVLDCLAPEKMRVYIGSKTFEGKTDHVAQYFETPYSQADIPKEFLAVRNRLSASHCGV